MILRRANRRAMTNGKLQGWKVHRGTWPEWADSSTVRPVRVGKVQVGGGRPVVIAGPCAVESFEQTLEIARAVRDAGADMLRGGAFKPRTSPYSFQGLGERGLEILAEVRERTGLPVVTEVMDTRRVELVAAYADAIQIGTRCMQNFPLLIEVGKAGKPVLLKRGWSATLLEWLGSAEYIALQGNLDIIMCERGIRTSASEKRAHSILDVQAINSLRKHTFLPVIADPSHATGVSTLVPSASLAALAAGADGMLVEVIGEHTERGSVLCDGHQAIRPHVLRSLVAAWHGAGSRESGDGVLRDVSNRFANPPAKPESRPPHLS